MQPKGKVVRPRPPKPAGGARRPPNPNPRSYDVTANQLVRVNPSTIPRHQSRDNEETSSARSGSGSTSFGRAMAPSHLSRFDSFDSSSISLFDTSMSADGSSFTLSDEFSQGIGTTRNHGNHLPQRAVVQSRRIYSPAQFLSRRHDANHVVGVNPLRPPRRQRRNNDETYSVYYNVSDSSFGRTMAPSYHISSQMVTSSSFSSIDSSISFDASSITADNSSFYSSDDDSNNANRITRTARTAGSFGSSSSINEETKCPICMEALLSSSPDEYIGTTVPCGHCFHFTCFQNWKLQSQFCYDRLHTTCPTCNINTKDFIKVYLAYYNSSSSAKNNRSKKNVALKDSSRVLKEYLEEIEILKHQNALLAKENTTLNEQNATLNEKNAALEMDLKKGMVKSQRTKKCSFLSWISYIFSCIKKGCINSSDDEE